jgi:hypothetical protein
MAWIELENASPLGAARKARQARRLIDSPMRVGALDVVVEKRMQMMLDRGLR